MQLPLRAARTGYRSELCGIVQIGDRNSPGWRICSVECFGPELKTSTLADGKISEQRQIQILKPVCSKGIPAGIAKRKRRRRAKSGSVKPFLRAPTDRVRISNLVCPNVATPGGEIPDIGDVRRDEHDIWHPCSERQDAIE